MKKKDTILIVMIVLDIVLLIANILQYCGAFILEAILSASYDAYSIGIIGGADGPTSVFIAGKIPPTDNLPLIALIVALIVTVVYIIIKRKKK